MTTMTLFRKIILFSVYLAASALGTAHAEPHLSGPLIQSINTDKAIYHQGDFIKTTVVLKNNTGSVYNGNLVVQVYDKGATLGSPISVPVSNLNNQATTSVDVLLTPPDGVNYQGYLVDIQAQNSSASVIDEETTSYDVSSDWWTYPRQCWITATWTDWGGYKPTNTQSPEYYVKSLNAYKCNNLQLYDEIYRWNLPFVNADSWVNGDKLLQQRDLITRNVSAAKSFRMGTLLYMSSYGANHGIPPTFVQDGSGTQLNWSAFTNDCGSTNSCTISDVFAYNKDISYMNLNNPNWQLYISRQAKLFKDAFGIDGIFWDSYGIINIALWDYTGARLINDTMYSSFEKTAASVLNAPMTLNPAGTYNEQDLIQANLVAYAFSERWNNSSDIANFGTFRQRAAQIWAWANRTPVSIGLDWDMGMDKNLMTNPSCNFNGGSTTCYFNTPGVLYQEAAILSAGSHHAWIVDGDEDTVGLSNGARFISNDDYPIGRMLTAGQDMVQGEYDYQTFGVAYEKLLRNNISASSVSAPTITSSGVTGSTTATAGDVYMIPLQRSGFQILHLLNYTQLTSANMTDVSDLTASAKAPTVLSSVSVKMYYPSGDTLGSLYIASPDISHGVPSKLTYSTGSDANGTFITFVVPKLNYWDMIFLEDNLASSDYAN